MNELIWWKVIKNHTDLEGLISGNWANLVERTFLQWALLESEEGTA